MNYYIGSNGSFMSEDELYHWKYIKREKVNGKWRYYYPGYDKTKVYDKAEIKYGKIWDDTDRKIDAMLRSRLVKEYDGPVDWARDKLGYDEKKRYESANNWATVEKETADHMNNRVSEVERDMKSDGVIDKLEKSQLDAFRTWPKEAEKRYNKWKPVADQMLTEYKQTPLYKIEQATTKIKNGMKKVANLFKKNR